MKPAESVSFDWQKYFVIIDKSVTVKFMIAGEEKLINVRQVGKWHL